MPTPSLRRSTPMILATLLLLGCAAQAARDEDPVPCASMAGEDDNPAQLLQIGRGESEIVRCAITRGSAARVQLQIDDPGLVDVDLNVRALATEYGSNQCTSEGVVEEEQCTVTDLVPGQSELEIKVYGLGDGSEVETSVVMFVRELTGPFLEGTTASLDEAVNATSGQSVTLRPLDASTPGASGAVAMRITADTLAIADGFWVRAESTSTQTTDLRVGIHDGSGRRIGELQIPNGEARWIQPQRDALLLAVLGIQSATPWEPGQVALTVHDSQSPLPIHLSAARAHYTQVSRTTRFAVQSASLSAVTLLHTGGCAIAHEGETPRPPTVREGVNGDSAQTRVLQGTPHDQWAGVILPQSMAAIPEFSAAPLESQSCDLTLASTTSAWLDAYAADVALPITSLSESGFIEGSLPAGGTVRTWLLDAGSWDLLTARGAATTDLQSSLQLAVSDAAVHLVVSDRYGRIQQGPSRRIVIARNQLQSENLLLSAVRRNTDSATSSRAVRIESRLLVPFIWPG